MLGTAIFTSLAVGLAGEFWQALLCIAIGSAITATAAWGCFVTVGCSERQPHLARFAIGFSIYSGLLVVGLIGIFLAMALFGQRYAEGRTSAYYILPDATVIRAKIQSDQVLITDPRGKPIEKYKDITSYEQLGELTSSFPSVSIYVDMNGIPWPTAETYRSSGRYFRCLHGGSANEAWYYVYRDRELAGYNISSAARIGAIGPGGFIAGTGHAASRFDAGTFLSSSHWTGNDRGLLLSPSMVFYPLVEQRRVDVLFQVPGGELPQDAAMSSRSDNDPFICVTTDKSVHVAPLSGGTAAIAIAVPLSHDPRLYTRVSISAVADSAYVEEYWSGWHSGPDPVKLPDYAARISPDGKTSAEVMLPPIEPVTPDYVLASLIGMAAMPPVGLFVGHDLPGSASISLCLVDSVLCAAIAFALGRRYAFTRAGRIGWTIAVLLLGPAALLTLFAIYYWPARERCLSCGRKRVVKHETCDHCTARFPSPATDGTEILIAY